MKYSIYCQICKKITGQQAKLQNISHIECYKKKSKENTTNKKTLNSHYANKLTKYIDNYVVLKDKEL